MRIADLSGGAARLRDSADVLAAKWDDTKRYWNDANSRSFEESRLKPLGDEVAAALAAIRQFAEVLAQAERECEPW